MRPELGRAKTAETAKAPIIRPTWDFAPWSSCTTKTGNTANSKNILTENKKLLEQSKKKSRVNSLSGATLTGEGAGCAGNTEADCDIARERIRISAETQERWRRQRFHPGFLQTESCSA